MFYCCTTVLRKHPGHEMTSISHRRPCTRTDGRALPSYFSPSVKRRDIHAAAGSGRTGLMCCRVSQNDTLPSLYFRELRGKTVAVTQIRKAGT
jgi:hypothetical protein